MEDRNININISAGLVVKTMGILALVWALYLLRDLVLVVLTAIVIAAAVDPFAKWFAKYKVPRTMAVVIVYAFAAVALVGILFLFAPTVISEISRFVSDLPRFVENLNLENILPESLANTGLINENAIQTVINNIKEILGSLTTGVLGTISFFFGSALSFVLITVLSFYLAVQEKGIENFLRVVVPLKHEAYALSLWERTKKKIGAWLQGQLVLALIVGVLVYLGLTLFQVKYALLLALLAALFELIPIFGPILAAVPAVIFGFLASPGTGLLVLGFYLLIQQFENHLIYPLVVTKIVGVPPLLVILALIVGAQLAGFLGIVLAIPLAAFLIEVFHDIEKDKMSRLQTKES